MPVTGPDGKVTYRWPRGSRAESANAPWNNAHLIGNMLGGTGKDPRNLVELDRVANATSMLTLENRVKRALQKGEAVQLRVQVLYRKHRQAGVTDAEFARPGGVIFSARGSNGLSLDYLVLNTGLTSRNKRPAKDRGEFRKEERSILRKGKKRR